MRELTEALRGLWLANQLDVLLLVLGERRGRASLGSFLQPAVREEAGSPRAGCVGEGAVGRGVAAARRKMPAPRRLLWPMVEVALSPQGIGTSTDPGAAAAPSRPRSPPFPGLGPGGWETGVGRRAARSPRPGRSWARASSRRRRGRGGLGRALGRGTRVRASTLTGCAAGNCLPGLSLSLSLKWR